jgi:hypothetical protein
MVRTADDRKLFLAVVLHELTDLPLDPPQMADAIVRNVRMWSEGGTHGCAAWATVLAVERARPGLHNIADRGTQVDTGKAQTKLDWSAEWRIS